MKHIKHWMDCKLFKKHRHNYYTGECIVCGK